MLSSANVPFGREYTDRGESKVVDDAFEWFFNKPPFSGSLTRVTFLLSFSDTTVFLKLYVFVVVFKSVSMAS